MKYTSSKMHCIDFVKKKSWFSTYFVGCDFRCLTKFDVVEDVSTTFIPHVFHKAVRFFVDVSKFLKPKITTLGVDMLLSYVSASGFVACMHDMIGQQLLCMCTQLQNVRTGTNAVAGNRAAGARSWKRRKENLIMNSILSKITRRLFFADNLLDT